MSDFNEITAGDPAPWFYQRSFANPRYAFHSAAGRYVVLCFFGSAGDSLGRAALDAALARGDLFDDRKASFFGVSCDPEDETQRRLADRYPGYRHFWDFDGGVSRLYGALEKNGGAVPSLPPRRRWVVLDSTLRVLMVVPFAEGAAGRVMDFLAGLPAPECLAGFEVQAPVLVLPQIFEPEFCARLIGLYEAQGGTESGFMRDVDGKTVMVHDHSHKRRKDITIEDPALVRELQARFLRRVRPMIQRAYQFDVTRMERYIVSCYSAEDEGHFNAHRDNTTRGTAHRRFAVSVNLNDDFDGGEVGFPEYGPRSYKAPAGGAVVFSCSLLHAVSKVTRGRRYAFLPFLYDEAAARIREQNIGFVGDGKAKYAAGSTP